MILCLVDMKQQTTESHHKLSVILFCSLLGTDFQNILEQLSWQLILRVITHLLHNQQAK
jgi:hypothetical protein